MRHKQSIYNELGFKANNVSEGIGENCVFLWEKYL